MNESCGVVGIASSKNIAPYLYYCLRALQHRGQESCGIAVYNKGVRTIKGMGLVHEVFSSKKLEDEKGNVGIAHTRYSTTGGSRIENAQPILVSTSLGDIGIGHNGDIVNSSLLKEKLQSEGWAFLSTTDSEIIVRLLANELRMSNDIVKAMRNVAKMIQGAYSLTIIHDDKIYAVRDPFAIKPLCIGKFKEGYVVASESVALDIIDAEFVRDVLPGEMVQIKEDGIESNMIAQTKGTAHCMFEYVYFSRPDSVIDGKTVYDVRVKIGERLAKEHFVDADLVSAVPDSGNAYAIGFSRESKIPLEEALLKNKYAWRTFILPEQEARTVGVKEKLNPIKSIVKGKRVILIDDSIVRGTTVKKIVQLVRNAGAKEIHVRVGSPPIISPCYFGIDMKTREQFIAIEGNQKREMEEIAKFITADSVGYVSIDGMVEAIGFAKNELCLSCLTEEYPMEIPGERVREQKTLKEF